MIFKFRIAFVVDKWKDWDFVCWNALKREKERGLSGGHTGSGMQAGSGYKTSGVDNISQQKRIYPFFLLL